MPRFYLPQTLAETLVITDEKLWREITLVKRARIGDELAFFDGTSNEDSVYTIEKIDKKSVTFNKTRSQKNAGALWGVTLWQAIPNKMEKIELIVQKCTELGVKKVAFFRSERSAPLVISEAKMQRLRAIATEAVEQSGGGEIPEIVIVEKLPKFENAIVLHTDEWLPKWSLTWATDIIVGPEGGFSEKEVSQFIASWARSVSLGNRILRTETAAIVAVGMGTLRG